MIKVAMMTVSVIFGYGLIIAPIVMEFSSLTTSLSTIVGRLP